MTKTNEKESRSSIQGEGGIRGHQGRTDPGGIGATVSGPSQPDHGVEEAASGRAPEIFEKEKKSEGT